MDSPFRSTTVVAVQRDGKAAIAGDGQVTLSEQTIMKHGAKKVRRLYHGRVVGGFAGSAGDALTLFDRFESMLQQHQGNLMRGAIELAKEWRTDRALRRLEALLLVADAERILLLSGTGEVIEPDDGVVAIGSGGPYALAAARALHEHTALSARRIVEEALRIASEICVFTNDQVTVEEIDRTD